MQPSARPGVHDPAVNPFDAIAARMESFAAAMSEGDGVRIFNGLYLAVTRAVGADFANDRFEDPAFFARLASVFAQLYFDAVECDAAKRPVSRVWAPLFEKRLQAGIAPLQFAMAGMNAHINYDLAIALVATTREFGYDLRLDSAASSRSCGRQRDARARHGRGQGALRDGDRPDCGQGVGDCRPVSEHRACPRQRLDAGTEPHGARRRAV